MWSVYKVLADIINMGRGGTIMILQIQIESGTKDFGLEALEISWPERKMTARPLYIYAGYPNF